MDKTARESTKRSMENEDVDATSRMGEDNRDTWLYADMWFFMPDKRKRDSHNTLKILLDVMEGFVYENDFYVMPRIQEVAYDKENSAGRDRSSRRLRCGRYLNWKITLSR